MRLDCVREMIHRHRTILFCCLKRAEPSREEKSEGKEKEKGIFLIDSSSNNMLLSLIF